ncbi:hypothetical protein SAMN05216377_13217 [Pseudonocardia oroxyli]|uniref:Uncharacterized protein n=2 Tax=Pseudonocardia oroxyli TaxID=366584 RepID=A0A1G8E990_PSEOR|nr:hypothetical protein SAMN05216377_13217 [Pseudonocardia oroxyli]
MRHHAPRPLNDAVIHEQDLRGALGTPGAEDTPGLAALRATLTERFAGRLPEDASLGLHGEAWSWTTGPEPRTVVRAPGFEPARGLISRRSAARLTSWTERGDLAPYLDAFAVLGALPEHDLREWAGRVRTRPSWAAPAG